MTPHREITDPQILKALSNPLRLQILRYLEEHAASPSMLADVFLSKPETVRSHVRILYGLGLIEVVKQVRKRGTMEYHYRAPERVWCTDDAWSHMPRVVRTATAGAALQVLGTEVRAAADAGGFDADDVFVTRHKLTLTPSAWSQLSKELFALRKRILELQAEEKERIRLNGDTDARQASIVFMLFETAPDTAVSHSRTPSKRTADRMSRSK